MTNSNSPFVRSARPLDITAAHWDKFVTPQIKLALFDVDGTLRNREGIVSPAVKEALSNLKARGCCIGLASGRPVFSARPLMEDLQLSAPSILLSGAAVVTPNGDVLSSTPIKPNIAIKLIQATRAIGIDCEAITIDAFHTEKESRLLSIHATYHPVAPVRVGDLCEVAASGRLLKFSLPVDERLQGNALQSVIAQMPELRFSTAHGAAHPELSFVNVTAHEVNPARALDEVLKILGISAAEAMSFGDGESDIPVLEKVGIGVAMGNARASVKAAATVVTEDVEKDGVAVALKRLMPWVVANNP